MKTKNGFTIIELIVVIAIVAILSSIVLLNVTQYIERAKITTTNVEVKNIGDAINLFNVQYNNYPYNSYYDCQPEYGYCYGQIIGGAGAPHDDSGHLLSEFYKLDWDNADNAKNLAPGAYYSVELMDNDGNGEIGCGYVAVYDGGWSFYGVKYILCQDCQENCGGVNDVPFQTEPYW